MTDQPTGVPVTDVPDDADYWRADCDRTEPHAAHLTHRRTCDHDQDRWCYGRTDPTSIAAQVAALRPGQWVRVTFEGYVDRPRIHDPATRPAVTIGHDDGHDMIVLRYTGTHPAVAVQRESPAVDGKVVDGVVAIEVVDG